jgi:hypothetical protein
MRVYNYDGGNRPQRSFSVKKNRLFMTGTLAVLLAFGLFLAGCKTDSDDDSGPGGGAVPDELVGKWYSESAYMEVLVFEITSANKIMLSGSPYDASVSGKTLTISMNGNTIGTFDYSISGSEMTITNGTLGCASYPSYSPVIKK